MTPLVLVHGFMGGADQWQGQDALADGRRLIRVDLPGFGANAHLPPLASIADFAAHVLDHLTALGVQRFDLLGHSMGGMIVQDMVQQAPDRIRRLILYGTGPDGVLPGRFEPIETSMQRARTDGAEATARRISATWFLHEHGAAAYPACARIAARSTLPAILGGLAAMRDWSGRAGLPAVTAPTLIVWGDRDRTYPWAQTEALWHGITGASLAVVPGCAHAVHAEKPDLFNSLVADFLVARRAAAEPSA